ncbi:peptidase A24 [Dankookia rubra]|uniref:Peptidase A24 n=1 Tax=Dankookia rubra TaxID=1442381 RepID=A0A4R5QB68_9PROT|nr:prepilin peptidase [Dankookia rubra]TDH59611.1 peptidase A24 [Dankookia rubra]
MTLITLIPLGAGMALLAAALHDIAARTIPNGLNLAIACAGLAARALAGDLLPGLVAAGLVFLLALAAWRCRVMGGGDVKLLAACALLASPAAVPGMVLAVALAGGVLALAYLGLRPLVPAPAPARPAPLLARARRAEAWRIRRRGPLPYGVAIALGTFFTLLG